jgi:transposase-like protein
MATEPKTLQDAIIYFADADNCVAYLVARRWPNGVICPTCGSENVAYVASRRLWQCKTRHPKAQFSIKVGTIFEDSPISLDKWLLAMWMLSNCKNGISSYELHRATGISQKSAWFVLQRIRLALQGEDGGKLSGEIEVDETYIGGKARNMHKDRKARILGGAGGGQVGKTAVQGLLERHGKIRTRVIGKAYKNKLVDGIREHVEAGSTLYTDDYFMYDGIKDYDHQVINHAEKYVDGQVHTNGVENFWSLLKRGIHGTYISVEPFHLFRYVDEQAFRFNNRKDDNGNPLTDSDRFDLAVRQIVGKRLTWAEVTGKVTERPEAIN